MAAPERIPGSARGAGLLLLVAQALKAYGWSRLFTSDERPKPLALAAGNGGAALIGLVLPGRFDDAMRVAVVRRYPPCPAGVRALCLSLVMLGLIDSAALAPLAFAAAVVGGAGNGARVGLAIVAVGGIAAAALIIALPRLVGSGRVRRFRLGRWLCPRTTASAGLEAWAFVSACWVVRQSRSSCPRHSASATRSLAPLPGAGATAAALPIGPAGTATQVGATTALLASGVDASGAQRRRSVTLGILAAAQSSSRRRVADKPSPCQLDGRA